MFFGEQEVVTILVMKNLFAISNLDIKNLEFLMVSVLKSTGEDILQDIENGYGFHHTLYDEKYIRVFSNQV